MPPQRAQEVGGVRAGLTAVNGKAIRRPATLWFQFLPKSIHHRPLIRRQRKPGRRAEQQDLLVHLPQSRQRPPHHREQLRLLTPRAARVDLLYNALSRTEAIEQHAAPEAFRLEPIVDAAAVVRAEVRAGYAPRFVEAEVLGVVERRRHAAQGGAAGAVGS